MNVQCYQLVERETVESLHRNGFHDARYLAHSDAIMGVKLTPAAESGEQGDTVLEVAAALTTAELAGYAVQESAADEQGTAPGTERWTGAWCVPAARLNQSTTTLRIVDYSPPQPDWCTAEKRGVARLPNDLSGEIIGAARMVIDQTPDEVRTDLRAALAAAVVRWAETDPRLLAEATVDCIEALGRVPLPVGRATPSGLTVLAIYAILARAQVDAGRLLLELLPASYADRLRAAIAGNSEWGG
jgi:hypothetical protein